jgi:hypothetical protein
MIGYAIRAVKATRRLSMMRCGKAQRGAGS